MEYPDDFNTPAFPAGKYVAVSRFMATAVMILFLVIMSLCGIIVWVKKSQNVTPFLVSVPSYGGRWTLVMHNKPVTEIPAYFMLQESFLHKFVKNWFTIHEDDIAANQANWAECSPRTSLESECMDRESSNSSTCAIYCACNDKVFENFKQVVLPIFSEIEAQESGAWTVQSIDLKPWNSFKFITQQGGMWQFSVSVKTGSKVTRFHGYARVGYNEQEYPRSMGYYISEFNTYRMN